MKKLLLLLSMTLLMISSVMAQKTITGTVLDEAAQPMVGASVVVKGTTKGAITDLDGKFIVSVPNDATVLMFSFTGYTTQEVVIGASNVLNVTLAEGKLLGETVITAFGIKKDKNNLGYAVSQITSEELTQGHTTNITNALAAKVPGVRISGGGGSFSSSSILIRGYTSFTGSNQPLFVVDGIAIDNGGGNNALQLGVTNSSRAIDINQEDIEAISVLKGPGATSLYGSRAANGVILITTKTGARKVKQAITYSANYGQQEVNRTPDYQNTYGQGNGGNFASGAVASWGPKIDGRTVVLPVAYRGATASAADSTKLTSFPNNVTDLFSVGSNLQHNLSFQGTNNKSTYRISLGYVDEKGVFDNNRLRRYNVGLNATTNITEKLIAGVSINYSFNKSQRTQQGNQLSNPLFRSWFTPRSWDLTGRPFQSATGANLHYDAVDNPRWTIANNLYDDQVERIFGNLNFRYQITDWLSATAKVGADNFVLNASYYDQIGANGGGGTDAAGAGGIRDARTLSRIINSTVLLQAEKKITNDLNLTFVLGNEVFDQSRNTVDLIGRGLTVRNFRNLAANSTTISSTLRGSNGINRFQYRLYGYFANATATYKNWATLDLSLRNDHNSILPKANNSYWYHSVAGTLNIVNMLNLKSDVLTGLKLRANTGLVGGAKADFRYSTDSYYGLPNPGDGFGPNLTFPFNGSPGFTLLNTAGNPDFKPEFTRSTEGGIELSLFKDKIMLNATKYRQHSTNIILDVPNSSAAGINAITSNAGNITTNGVEGSLTFAPFKNPKGFGWSTTLNYTQFKSVVDILAPGVQNIFLGGFTTPNIRLVAGDEFGQIYGNAYQRNADGKMIVSATTGLPLITPGVQKIGNPNPKFLLGISNSFSFKGLELSVLLDIKEGGDQYSRNLADLQRQGAAAETAVVERLNADGTPTKSYIFDAVTPAGAVNTIAVTSEQYWGNAGKYAAAEGFIYNTSWFRIREASLTYTFSKDMLKNTAIGDLSLGIFGRNLFLKSPNYPHFDPEQNALGVSNAQGLEFNSLPQTRTIGVNLRVSF